ncbi:ATP-binding cassette domain-containing protein [Enterococcus sp. S86.2]|uniref:ABC transporter ATP-binding protein n=1 Tax=Enterococcus sp. S86.2 TaxID=3031299 RepID=UPI0026F3323E|nr:ABC transporter ATP-binding protein [Enterococcus sp. S86.2]
MLTVHNLTVNYKKQSILTQLDFSIEGSEVVGLVAPNGTGKTTFLKSLVGLLPRLDGTLTIDETIELANQREKYLKQTFFLESAQNLYPDLTVKQHLEMIKELWHSTILLSETLALFQIASFQDMKVRNLSLGMKQQLLLSLYYISDAHLLFFDEPLNGLDPTNTQLFNSFIKKLAKQNKAIIMSSHNLESVAALCTRVVFLHNGKLVELSDTSDSLQEKYNELFGVPGGFDYEN